MSANGTRPVCCAFACTLAPQVPGSGPKCGGSVKRRRKDGVVKTARDTGGLLEAGKDINSLAMGHCRFLTQEWNIKSVLAVDVVRTSTLVSLWRLTRSRHRWETLAGAGQQSCWRNGAALRRSSSSTCCEQYMHSSSPTRWLLDATHWSTGSRGP